MVIKGSARGGAAALAAHLQRTDTNERAELREVRGVVSKDLLGALREIEAVASGARSKRPFYHASINTRADELLAPEQWTKAIDRLEQELGLAGQPRVVVAHLKEGRAHVHVAWSRIDLDTMKAISDSHNYRRHEIAARDLEREFGHARVQGAHIEREGQGRPKRTPSHGEMQQAERTGRTPDQAKAELTQIWNRTDSGRAFAAAIEEQGWVLARGDRRDFVVIDPAGEAHSLGRRIEGARATSVRARMADVDVASLPTVAEARVKSRVLREERDHLVSTHVNAPQPSSDPTPGVRSITSTVQPRVAAQIADNQDAESDGRRNYLEKTTANGGMVAQQTEAQKRFERWAEVRARRQTGGVEPERGRGDHGADDRSRSTDGRER